MPFDESKVSIVSTLFYISKLSEMNLKSNKFLGLGKFFSTLFFSLTLVLLLQQLFFPVINSLIGISSSVEARANLSIYGIIYPLNTYYNISSGFGPRWGRNHNGIDLAAPTGTAIYAIQSGKVEVGNDPSGYGSYVVVDHDGFSSLYAHLSKTYVKNQQKVKQGYKIGEVGETGNAQGAHLHFEMLEMRNKSWSAFDPAPFLVGAALPKTIQSPNDTSLIAENVPDCLRSNGRSCGKPYKPRELPSCADSAWGACLRRKIS